MPSWGWILIGYGVITGLLNIWLWQRSGDGLLAFALRFSSGFAAVPLMALWLIVVDLKNRRYIRRNKAAFQA